LNKKLLRAKTAQNHARKNMREENHARNKEDVYISLRLYFKIFFFKIGLETNLEYGRLGLGLELVTTDWAFIETDTT
jgi:hypothetical protein